MIVINNFRVASYNLKWQKFISFNLKVIMVNAFAIVLFVLAANIELKR